MKITPSITTGIVLLSAGAYNTYNDYKLAHPEKKKRVLTRNISVISASAIALAGSEKILSRKFSSEVLQNFSHKISKAIVKREFIRKIFAKLMPKKELKPVKLEPLADMISDCTKDMFTTAAIALTGISIGLIVDKNLVKHKKKSEDPNFKNISTENSNNNANDTKKENPIIKKITNDTTKNIIMNTTKVFDAAGVINSPLEKPAMIMNSISISKEKDMQKLVEHTASGIVAEALIPTFFISFTNILVKNKSLKTKIPAFGLSFFIGEFLGKKAGEILTHEIRDEIFDIDDDKETETETKNEKLDSSKTQSTENPNTNTINTKEESDDDDDDDDD